MKISMIKKQTKQTKKTKKQTNKQQTNQPTNNNNNNNNKLVGRLQTEFAVTSYLVDDLE